MQEVLSVGLITGVCLKAETDIPNVFCGLKKTLILLLLLDRC